MSQNIKLSNDVAVHAPSIVAVQTLEAVTHMAGTALETTLKYRVKVIFKSPTSSSVSVFFDTPEEARAEAARIINEWEEALKP